MSDEYARARYAEDDIAAFVIKLVFVYPILLTSLTFPISYFLNEVIGYTFDLISWPTAIILGIQFILIFLFPIPVLLINYILFAIPVFALMAEWSVIAGLVVLALAFFIYSSIATKVLNFKGEL